MYRLETKLSNFKFNTVHQLGPLTVMWYKLDETDGDEDNKGKCLTKEELDQLINYVVNNKINFGNQNYFSCDDEENPGCDLYDPLPIDSLLPANLIVRKELQLGKSDGNIYRCMDIELLNANGTTNHNYSLDFDIIGEVIN
ncbi:MAG: hypothetical protein GDA51_14320 [Ekhidna sp.]|nr:hypothetical protein [Ekhidna sp.]